MGGGGGGGSAPSPGAGGCGSATGPGARGCGSATGPGAGGCSGGGTGSTSSANSIISVEDNNYTTMSNELNEAVASSTTIFVAGWYIP